MSKLKRFLAFLLALIMVVELVPFNATEVSAAEPQQQSVATGPNVAATYTDATAASAITWDYTTAFAGTGATTGKLDARWNATTLFIGVAYTNATTLTVNVGSKQFQKTLVSGGKDVMEISFADAGITLLDYNQQAAFSATLTGSGTASISDATLHFALGSGDALVAVNVAAMTGRTLEGAITASGTTMTIDGTFTASDVAAGWMGGNYQPDLRDILGNVTALRSADLLLEQTFHIEKLPVSNAAGVSDLNRTAGLRFNIGDRTGTPTRTEYQCWGVISADAEGKLYLVLGNSASAVDLGVSLGDTFKLGVQWNQDNTMQVYVNDCFLQTITDGVSTQLYQTTEAYAVSYSKLAGEVKLTISDPVIKAALPVSFADSIQSDAVRTAIAGANPGVDLSAVTGNLVLPATITDTYLGALPITWESSDPAAIAADGTVTRAPGQNKNVTLTAKVGAAVLGTVAVTVWRTGVVLVDFDMAAKHTADAANISWDYPVSFLTNETTPSGGLNAYWDKDNLYIGVEYADAEQLTLTVNGVALPAYSLATNGQQVFTISWADVNVTLSDYNQVVSLQAVLTDINGKTAQIADTAANVHLVLNSGEKLQDITMYAGALSNMTDVGGVLAVDKTFAAAEAATAQSATVSALNSTASLRSRDVMLLQTVCIEKLPVVTPAAASAFETVRGLYFFLCDRSDASGRADNIMQAVFYADASGKLSLVIGKSSAVIDLGVSLGQTFVLGTQWNRDDSVDVYVNGIYLQTVANASYVQNYTAPQDVYGVRVNNTTGAVKASFSDKVICQGVPVSVVAEADMDSLLAGMDLSAVMADLNLPASFTSAYLGDVAITWESSDPSVIANDGKVTRPAGADARVELTAKAGSTVLGKAVATVKRTSTPVNNDVTVYYAADLASITTWNRTQELLGNDTNATGKLGAFWNKDNLFISVEYRDAAKLQLQLGSYNKTFDLDTTKTEAVFTVPMSETGIAITDYNQVLKLQAVLLDSNGKEAKLAATFENLYLSVSNNATSPLLTLSRNNFPSGSYTNGFTITGGNFVLSGTLTDQGDYVGPMTPAQGQPLEGFYAKTNASNRSAVIDHVKYDLMWQNTITVNALPVGDVAESVAVTGSDGFTLFINDRYDLQDHCVKAALYNTGSGLALYIHNAAKSVELGVNVGDTFVLGLQWNKDNSLDVYVDGRLVRTVADVTITVPAGSFDNDCLGYTYYNIAGAVAIDITDATVSEGIPSSVVDEITAEALLGDQKLDAVREDLTLPTTFTSSYLGDLNVTWASSNPAVIAPDGKVTRQPSGDVTVDLTAYYKGAAAFTVSANVMIGVPAQADLVPAAFITDTTGLDWRYTNGITGATGPQGGFRVYWGRDNLYIGAEYGSATKMTVNAAGKEFTFNLDSSKITDIFTIPMSNFEDVLEYHETIDFVITLSNAAGSNSSAAAGKGKLLFCLTPAQMLLDLSDAAHVYKGGSINVDHSQAGVFVFDTETAIDAAVSVTDATDPSAIINSYTRPAVMDHYAYDLLAQQTIRIDAMPEADYVYAGTATTGGFVIDMIDRVQNNGSNCKTITGTIVNKGGKLYLYVSGNETPVDLGVKLGETFKLGIQWNKDDTAFIIVNDVMVSKVQNATDTFAYNGNDSLEYRYNTMSDEIKITVTDPAVWNGMPTSRKAELSQLVLLGNQDLSEIRQDITLPTTYTSAYTGVQQLKWISSDPAHIAADGKVTRDYSLDKQVTLSLSWKDETLWSVDALVMRKVAPKSDLVKAFHTADAANAKWTYTNGIVGGEGLPMGSVEAYWDKDNLYVGVEYMDATQLTVYVKGKAFTFDLDAAKMLTQQTIAWADIDPQLQIAYNETIPFYVELSNANGKSASSTASAGKLVFLLPVDTSWNVGLRAHPDLIDNMDVDELTGKIILDTATNVNGETTVTDPDAGRIYMSSVMNSAIDHDLYDVMLQQTIRAEALPVTTPAFTDENGTISSNGLTFFMGDRGEGGWFDVRLALFSLHNTADGLVLLVGTNESNTAATPIQLNKKLGDTFKLGTQWNMDDTVDIYVDSIYVATVENVTRHYDAGQANFGVYYNYIDLYEDTRIVIEEAVVSNGIPMSKLDELSAMSLVGAIAKTDVRESFQLKGAYESKYLGTYAPITWTSTNENVLKIVTDTNTGEVTAQITRPAGEDVTAVITATYDGTVTCSVPVTIKGTATTGTAVENAWHTMNVAQLAWENDNAILDASGKAVGGLQTAWDKDYLYVSYDLYKDFTSLQIDVAGKSVKVTLDATMAVTGVEGAKVSGDAIIGLVAIPVAQIVKWTESDYNCSVDFAVSVAGENDAKGATAAGGKLYFRIPAPTTTNYTFPLLINNYEGGVYNVDYTTTEGIYVFDNEKKIDAFTSVTTSSAGKMYLGGKGRSEVIDHYSYDVLVEQTIRIDAMPSATYKYDKTNSTGLTIYLIDRVNNNINNCQTMYASVVNNNGKLVLHLANTGKFVDLGKGLGETFKLGLQWNMNDSVDVYIDGIYNTTIADVTVVDSANGNDNLTYAYNNLKDEVKITLTDVAVYQGIPATIVGELSQPNVLAGLDLNKILADISLPSTYESPYIGTVSGITWSSDNAAYITDAGKVTRPAGADVQVGLTASYKNEKLWTATATVKAVSPARAQIAAYNTTAASAANVDWNYTNGFAGGAGAPTGSIGAAWTPDSLMLGVEYKNATKLTVYANGKAFEKELKANANVDTMTIALSDFLDVSKLDYNQAIPFYAVLSNGAASASTGTADTGKLYFALKAAEGMNVGLRANTDITTNFSVDPLTGVMVFDNTNNANGKTTITDRSKENLLVSAWDKELLDHDVNDVMLEQTFYIEALPKSSPTFINETGTTSTNGFTFYFGDRGAGDWQDIRIALFSIHNTDKGLALYVADGSVGAGYSDGTIIYLNRQVGETFTLGTQWNKDDSVDVYLDGAYLRTVKSVTRAYQNAQVNFNLYYKYANLSGDTRITVTKAYFGKGIPKNLADEVEAEKLFAGVDLNAVRGDLPMGTTYKSPYLGTIDAQWTSSEPAVIDPLTGKVTRSFEKDIDVKLSLKLRGAEMWTTTVKVKKAHEAQKNELVAMHTFQPVATAAGVLSDTAWGYNNGIVGATQNVYGNISAMWDKDTIYLGMEYTGAKTAAFVVNGKTINVNLEAGTSDTEGVIVAAKKGVAEIVIPMSVIKLKLMDYERTVKFRVTLSDGTNTADGSAAANSGYIRFTTPSSAAFYLNLGQEKPDLQTSEGSAGWDEPYFKDGGTIGGGKVVYSANDDENHNVATRAIAAIDHNRNQQLDQTITVSEMPVTQVSWLGENIANGYYFYMADRAINPNKAATSSYARMVYNVLHHVGDGKLVLEVNGGSAEKLMTVDLGVKIGQTFTLSTVWEADDTYIVYVNGKKVAEYEDMTFLAAGHGQDMLMMGYKDTIPGQATLTVSDIKITNLPYTSINQEVNAVSVFADEVPTMLEDDIQLPKTYESRFLGELSLSWKSGNTEYLTNSGKVTRPQGIPNGVNVDLTMSIVGLRELFTISPLVKSAAAESVKLIQAAFSEAPIVVDGTIADEGWVMNTSTRTEGGKLTANFGVQWDLDHLYIAVKTENISALKLTLAEQNISLGKAGVEYVTKDNFTEIKIPFSNLGITVRDYGIEIPINMTVGEGVYDGTIRITSLDWFSSDREGYRIKGIPGTSDAIPNLGVQALDSGYYFFDHYDPEVPENNLTSTQASTMLVWEKKNPGIATVVPLWPVDETYYVSFDFQAESMPVYTAAAAAPDIRRGAYGLSFYIAGHRSGPLADNPNETVLGGIYNAGEEGLQLVISGDISMKIFPLNRYVGDLFRVGIACDEDGDVTVFCDGEEIGYIERAEKKLTGMCSWGCDGAVVFAQCRDLNAPQSEADNFDLYITNFSFGLYYGDELLDSLNFDEFGDLNCNKYWDEEEELSQVMMDIEILPEFANDQLTRPVKLTWESANEDIVNSKTGKVTRPETNGQLVPFTCTTEAGKTKTFDMYVKGMNPDDQYMWVYRDFGAYQGVGEVVDVYKFTLDEENNSIIYNQKESKPFNVVKLTDGDEVARMHTDFVELFVSDDNVTYTQIKDYKLLHDGCNWYLYGFQAEGQYVKVHYTMWNGDDADMEGLLQGFITVYQEEEFGQGEGTFANTTEYILTNDTGRDAQDEAWKIPVSELGDIFATETYADTRVYLGETILYHYYEDGNIVVRVPALAKGDSVKLTIKSGNASAMDISNKEYVHEIIYGTREAWLPQNFQLRLSDCWTLPDGTVIGCDIRSDGNGIAKQYSYDNMQTWTKPEIIPETQGLVSGLSGFSWDDYYDRLVMQTYTNGGQGHVFFSSDGGLTWVHNAKEDRTCECPHTGNYVNGLTLSTNDGDGPNVDFMMGGGGFWFDENGVRKGLEADVWYSRDAGVTWQKSESMLRIETPMTVRNGTLTENGLSENSYYETEDGTVVLYIRWQWMNVNHFAVYYSYDHGVTWTADPVHSKIYTVNTNPVFYEWGDTPLLVWSSNAAFGGTSYRRIPINIATFAQDDNELMDINSLQDLYLRTSYQGMDTATQQQATNPTVVVSGDNAAIGWFNNFNSVPQILIEDFTDYMYKTKGAYDSFESRTMKYEGWAYSYGRFEESSAQASHGNKSLFIGASSVAGRSIGYVKNGTYSMDIYCEGDDTDLKLELQNAYSNDEFIRTSPVKVVFEDGKFDANGTVLTLNEGWNTVEFNVDLGALTATLSVNGETADLTKDICYGTRSHVTQDLHTTEDIFSEVDDYAFEPEIGDFVNWVRIDAKSNIYLDNFLVIDRDEVVGLESNGGIGEDGEGFDLVTNLWWIILVICLVVALVIIVIITSKKKGAAKTNDSAPQQETNQ